MMDVLVPILVIGSVLAAAAFVGWTDGRISVDGDWAERSQHKCGHIDRYGGMFGAPCKRCGERGNFKRITARAVWPFGWEIKP